MTTPQAIYLTAVIVYLFFFLLFARFFLWKRYADQRYWNRRPKLSLARLTTQAAEAGRELPYISVLVPARNEADVIERTVDHLSRLQYPKSRYEILVVSDEKEVQAAEAARPKLVSAVNDHLAKGVLWPAHLNGRGEELMLGLLTRLLLDEWPRLEEPYGRWLSSDAFAQLPEKRLEGLVRETAKQLVRGRGKIRTGRVFRDIRKALPDPREEVVQRVYPVLLSLAMPVVMAFTSYRKDASGRMLARMVTYTARAHHSLTREILFNLTEAVSHRVLGRVARLQRRRSLALMLDDTYSACFPTTQDILERKAAEFAGRTDVPQFKHVVVPYDFDGRLGGNNLGVVVPSTKGRALNYALRSVDERSEMCGFYDAESRPDLRVLLYVASRRMEDGAKAAILQGPVFQVRNFYEMHPFCKIASLYQAVAHDWYLPALFRRLPFVGGTNLFVDTRLLHRIGGYDQSSLTEDLELGTRAYLQCGAWPEYLPYPSSEQTPPSVTAFYRQRLRWGTGHLQVMDKIRTDTQYDYNKRLRLLRELFRKGQAEWVLYQFATFVPPAVMVLYWNGLVDPQILPEWVRWGLNVLSLIYIGFTIYAFFRYLEHVDRAGQPRAFWGQLAVVGQLFFLPLAAFVFPVPYSSALLLKAVGLHPKTWTKTPRTRE
ncbi:MAG: glycosyltransferase [Firmicutes bacterium]|nr:glycosyltransferase [Bacillota bacterium]